MRSDCLLSISSDDVKNEIKCLEMTVRKRRMELEHVETSVRAARKQVFSLKETKAKVEYTLRFCCLLSSSID